MSANPSGLTRTKKLLFSLVAIFLFFALAELLLRVWVYYFRDEYERYNALTGIPYLVPGIHRAGQIVVNSDGFVGAELMPRRADLWRVVALGDSNTFGHGSPVHAYPAVLGRLLGEKAVPGRRYEVINAGVEGLDSFQALARLREKVLPLAPNVLVVYIGWNDLMKFDPRGQARPGPISSLSRALDGLWFIKGMRKLIFVQLRPRFDPPATGPVSHTGRFADFEPGIFMANLRQIISEGRAAGAVPALMTMITVVRPEATPQDLVKARVFFPYYPSAYAVGDFLDLVAAYNRAIRKVAREERVPVVDLETVFGTRRDYRELFIDTMHPSQIGYELVAASVFAVMEKEHLFGNEPQEGRGSTP